ncbi:hypothetical protein B0H14DRAFT_3868246 [Mycena olivaceomarginata]|nr:hypothetical protein B0H14DRAFT_3868246 [Mycena olivaceomarginata]
MTAHWPRQRPSRAPGAAFRSAHDLVPTKDALAGKGSLHLIHGLDLARAIVAGVHYKRPREGEQCPTLLSNWTSPLPPQLRVSSTTKTTIYRGSFWNTSCRPTPTQRLSEVHFYFGLQIPTARRPSAERTRRFLPLSTFGLLPVQETLTPGIHRAFGLLLRYIHLVHNSASRLLPPSLLRRVVRSGSKASSTLPRLYPGAHPIRTTNGIRMRCGQEPALEECWSRSKEMGGRGRGEEKAMIVGAAVVGHRTHVHRTPPTSAAAGECECERERVRCDFAYPYADGDDEEERNPTSGGDEAPVPNPLLASLICAGELARVSPKMEEEEGERARTDLDLTCHGRSGSGSALRRNYTIQIGVQRIHYVAQSGTVALRYKYEPQSTPTPTPRTLGLALAHHTSSPCLPRLPTPSCARTLIPILGPTPILVPTDQPPATYIPHPLRPLPLPLPLPSPLVLPVRPKPGPGYASVRLVGAVLIAIFHEFRGC